MEDHVFHIMKKLMHNNGRFLRENLENLDLYPGQPKMIRILSQNDGMTKKDLAERLSVASPTITKMVERLEKNGFVYSKKDDHDKRITKVFLDSRGWEVLKELKAFTEEITKVYLKGLSDEEIDLFLKLMDKVNANIEGARQDKGKDDSCYDK